MAVTEPFNVAPVEETLEAADVVTEGELAGINERTFPYVVPAELDRKSTRLNSSH